MPQNSFEVRVTGLRELGQGLDQLEERVQKQYIRKALKPAAELVRSEVEARAPRRTGELAANIRAQATTQGRFENIQFRIGVRYQGKVAASSRYLKKRQRGKRAPSSEDPAVYDIWLEFGRPGRKRTGHTYQAAEPFMRPAFDATKDEAPSIFAQKLKELIGL